jgi:ribosomal protein S18 acetylase RimI-like enzyme
MTPPSPIDRFGIDLDVVIRPCAERDLVALEWFGIFQNHRDIIRQVFAQQIAGAGLILVADVRGFPVGQVWIDFQRHKDDGAALLWALRVFAFLRSRGIAGRLIAAAEEVIRARGFAFADISMEASESAVQPFYERRGYRVIKTIQDSRQYTTPAGTVQRETSEQTVLRKALMPGFDVRRLRVGVRWTIGDASPRGFDALRLSILGARRVFGPQAAYAVCVNSVPLQEARQRTGPVPREVAWHAVGLAELPEFLRPHIGSGMAEGVAWKLAPLRLFPDRWEISLDNDCIIWRMPTAIADWLARGDERALVIAEDVRPCFGRFADACGDAPRNTGIRGMPPGFELGTALAGILAERGVEDLVSELDEQGMQVAAFYRAGPVHVVSVREVAICSPFWPHRPELGSHGAHFVGLNARRLPWTWYGRPAAACTAAHFDGHLPALYRAIGTPARTTQSAADSADMESYESDPR